jgi:hypothetical protein
LRPSQGVSSEIAGAGCDQAQFLSAPGVEEFFAKQDRCGFLNPNQTRQTLG